MSGRKQELVTKPSNSKPRDGEVEYGYEYDDSIRHSRDSKSKQPMRYPESLSHHHGRGRDKEIHGSNLRERREYEWNARYNRSDKVYSRPAPPVGRLEKKPRNDEKVVHVNPPRVYSHRRNDYADYDDYNDGRGRYVYEDYTKDGHGKHELAEYEEYDTVSGRYGYAECEDYNDEAIRKPNHGYGYDDSVEISKEKGRFLVANEHGSMPRNVVPVEVAGQVQGYEQDAHPVRFCQDHAHVHGQVYEQDPPTFRVRPDLVHGKAYEQDPQAVRLRSDHVHGKAYDQDPMPVRLRQDRGQVQVYGQSSQSYSALEMRRSKEDNEYYQEMPPEEEYYMENYYKDKQKYARQPRTNSYPSSPPQPSDFGNQHVAKGVLPSTSSGVIRNDIPGRLQGVDTLSFDEYPRNPGPSENLVVQEYGQRPQLEPRKGYEAAGCVDRKCLHCNPYGYPWNEHDDYAYVSPDFRGSDDPGHGPHDLMYVEDHAHTRLDSEHRYMQRMAVAKPIADNPKKPESSKRVYNHNDLREVETIQKEEISGHEDSRRSLGVTSTQEADCLNSGFAPAEFARRTSQDLPLNDAAAYDHGRHVNVPRMQGERVKNSAELVEPEEAQRVVMRENRYADEQVAYNGRLVKRKYIQVEEPRRSSLGTSQKWNIHNGSQHVGDCRPEWNDVSSCELHSQVPSVREPNLFLEAKNMMNEINQCKDSARHSWSQQGKCENMRDQSRKSFEPGRKYLKVHPKSEYSKGYDRSHYVSHRNDRYKQHYACRRDEGEAYMDSVARKHTYSEDLRGHLNYDQCEDSDNFKQSVLAAFLMYSKKLNENPPIRRLYKHQGNSGTLFCVVCGRSGSKVFRDTEGLTKHTVMARKPILRAQHLGLHRAICVLMGWSFVAPSDSILWVPRALPLPEAMAQKEDLIIWQPTVIVHNITLSNANHKEWKVINLEVFENIIRAKDFIRSKIKICLGYPGDQSVMLVKFLGTFTGLQEAEKLHKYFAEKGRGRADFEQAVYDMNKNGGKQIDEDELLLYGYMGIAEDLDRIDLDTKKRCKIQSKMEIQVLVDAPLKRD